MRKLSLQELNRIDVETFKNTEKFPICVVLDNIRSANNVGSVFRTSDAFLVDSICICGYTPKPPHKEIQKTAIGATESMEWNYFENVSDCIAKLRNDGYEIIAIEQADKSIKLHEMQWDKSKKYALILGNEVKGVSEEAMALIDHCVEVPQFGTKHSLNISVCTGVVLWDVVNSLKLN